MGGNSVVQLHISRSLAKIAHSSAGYGEKATTKNILYSQPLLLFCASPHCVRLSQACQLSMIFYYHQSRQPLFFPFGLEMQPSEKKMSIFEQKTRFDSSSLARHESVLKMERRNWIYYSNMSTQNHYGSANLACFPFF